MYKFHVHHTGPVLHLFGGYIIGQCGVVRAADTGTALVQGKAFIDLYYETYEESVESAVIPVTVYVLDDETAARYKEQNDAILEADTVVGR